MPKIKTDILIIGGGAAGMSSALSIAENSRSKVLVVDDNPHLGGQIWRRELGKIKSPEAKKLIEKIRQNKIEILKSTQIFAQIDEKCLWGETPDGTVRLHFEKLILATGARERFLPFPNWTLPNVFGAGGLQALVKSGLPVKDKRIVISGTGPLLLAVAEYLKTKGAKVLLVAEQTSRKKLLKFGFGLWKEPKKLVQAVLLRAKLLGISYVDDCFVASAEGVENLEAVNLSRKGKIRRIECDFLACGFHLVPNTELARLAGCKISRGVVSVNDFQETSVPEIYCAGEPTGIGGVELSLIEGKIAGLCATGKKERAKEYFSDRQKAQIFSEILNKTFSLRDELKNLSDENTIVCRCEDVAFGKLKEFGSFREAKLQTRCGMGACQGRICGSATEIIFGWENPSVRPPIFPVKLENLADS